MHEEEQVRRASSIADRMAFRRGSRIRAQMEDHESAKTEVEEFEQEKGADGGYKEDV